MSAGALRGQGVRSPGAGFQLAEKHLMFWELNLDPLAKQSMLFTAKPSLQSLIVIKKHLFPEC